jgi:hypothetical protein
MATVCQRLAESTPAPAGLQSACVASSASHAGACTSTAVAPTSVQNKSHLRYSCVNVSYPQDRSGWKNGNESANIVANHCDHAGVKIGYHNAEALLKA